MVWFGGVAFGGWPNPLTPFPEGKGEYFSNGGHPRTPAKGRGPLEPRS